MSIESRLQRLERTRPPAPAQATTEAERQACLLKIKALIKLVLDGPEIEIEGAANVH